jgi:signal transduction histidine kinase
VARLDDSSGLRSDRDPRNVRQAFPARPPRVLVARGSAKHFGPRGDDLIAAGTASTASFTRTCEPRWQGTTITGTIGVALDVTDRVHSQVLDSVARLANAAAHEINNPLMVILAQVEMLASSVPPEKLHRIESCRLTIERMSATVHSMSRLTRLEAATGWPPDLPAMLDLRRSAQPRD